MKLEQLKGDFQAWPKIPRGQGEGVTITEKIDGTNACIQIVDGVIVGIQSRNNHIYPCLLSGDKSSDNAGFAAWVMDNEEGLLQLGDGHHYGEWAGPSIQKNPHKLEEKTFFLFNTFRWNEDNPNRPTCCSVVPVLYNGQYTDSCIKDTLTALWDTEVAKGCIPEGVIAYFHKTKRYEKHTFRDQSGKWRAE